MAKQDDRVKIRELPPEDGDKNITSADWLAIGKKATEITVKASVGEVIGSGIQAGDGIQVDNIDNDSFTGVKITNTYSAPEVDLSDIQDDINTNKTDIANLQNNKVAAFAHVDPKPPYPPSKGDLWWDTNTAKMYVYTGDAWVVTTPGASGKNYDDDIKSLDERIRRLPTTGGGTSDCGELVYVEQTVIFHAHNDDNEPDAKDASWYPGSIDTGAIVNMHGESDGYWMDHNNTTTGKTSASIIAALNIPTTASGLIITAYGRTDGGAGTSGDVELYIKSDKVPRRRCSHTLADNSFGSGSSYTTFIIPYTPDIELSAKVRGSGKTENRAIFYIEGYVTGCGTGGGTGGSGGGGNCFALGSVGADAWILRKTGGLSDGAIRGAGLSFVQGISTPSIAGGEALEYGDEHIKAGMILTQNPTTRHWPATITCDQGTFTRYSTHIGRSGNSDSMESYIYICTEVSGNCSGGSGSGGDTSALEAKITALEERLATPVLKYKFILKTGKARQYDLIKSSDEYDLNTLVPNYSNSDSVRFSFINDWRDNARHSNKVIKIVSSRNYFYQIDNDIWVFLRSNGKLSAHGDVSSGQMIEVEVWGKL
jgi:hypothetical protein